MVLRLPLASDSFAPIPIGFSGNIAAGRQATMHEGLDAWSVLYVISSPAPSTGVARLKLSTGLAFVMPTDVLLGPIHLPPKVRVFAAASGTTDLGSAVFTGVLSPPAPVFAVIDEGALARAIGAELLRVLQPFLPRQAESLPRAPVASVSYALGPGSLTQPSGLRARAKGR